MRHTLMNLMISLLIVFSGSSLFFPFINSEIGTEFTFSGNDEFLNQDFSTYFGDGYIEELADSCIDDEGNIYVVGSTQSSYFPTTPGAYSGNQGDKDAFVAKIDPTCEKVIFSTYLGGSGIDFGKGICVDDEGYVYVTGHTSSDDFPTTTDAFNRTNYGSYDIFVTKFEPDGSDLVYSTYIGGRSYDWAEKIDVDADGSAYIIGRSLYDGYPVTDPSFPKTDGPTYLVVTKFDPTGSSLDYSIKMGSGGVTGYDIAVDDKKNTYVTGAVSGRFYTTSDAFDETYNGYYDAFVVKFDPSGQLVFSTFVGGSFDDKGYGIAVDSNEDIYVTGVTSQLTMGSYDFPVTTGAFKTYMNSSGDAFVFKMNKSGGSLEYSTYLGGDTGEYGISIDLDNFNNAYVTGCVGSDDYHTTYGAFSRTKFGGTWDAFLTVMNEDGSDLLYSTFLGGSENDRGTAVHYIGNNTVLIGGYTDSDDFPVSQGAIQTEHGPFDDGFVTILNLTTVPNPPRNLSNFMTDDHSLILSWDEPVFNGGSRITGYNIYRASVPGEFKKISSTPSENLSISILDHDLSKAWRYYVRAENDLGESLPSNILILDDLIKPDFLEDNTPSIAYTGDILDFNIEVFDNIGIKDVILEIHQDGMIIFNQSMKKESYNDWEYLFTVPYSIEPLEYHFSAFDFRDNVNISIPRSIEVRDNDPPMIHITSVPEIATTGDDLVIECELFDYINLEGAFLEIQGEGHSKDPIPFSKTGSLTWNCFYSVPSDNVNELEFSINATDGLNFNATPWRSLQVRDNDPPELLGDTSDLIASNGKEYHFLMEMIDNIGIKGTWCLVSLDNGTFLNITLDHLEDDYYSGSVSIPENAITFSYIPCGVDAEGNLYIGEMRTYTVRDQIDPVLLDDRSPVLALTGDPYEFLISVDDNIGIGSVSIEYWYGNEDHNTTTLLKDELYRANIMIPFDSLDNLHYQIIIDDVRGNRFTSKEKSVNIIDNDLPELIIGDVPDVVGTGEHLVVDVETFDNIGLNSLSVELSINSNLWFWDNYTLIEDMERWDIKIPEDVIGDLSIMFFVSDTFDNMNSSGPYMVSIEDVISPVIIPIQNITVKKGENFQLKIIASDNIGIESIIWEGLPSSSNGNIWEGKLDETGDQQISVRVIDGNGNEQLCSFTISVEDERNEHTLINILVIVFIIILLILSALIVFFLIRRNGDGSNQENDLVDS